MEFGNSTQARSWLFDTRSLDNCRQRAVDLCSNEQLAGESALNRVRNFASGYQSFGSSRHETPEKQDSSTDWSDQALLLQFHCEQMHTLIGPCPLLSTELRRSDSVLSTAITFLRRFYLSNSVIDISPRKIAVASAFLAAKVEEEKVEASSLSHATVLLQARVGNSPLCRRELRAVSEAEILMAEMVLMKGLNWQFRCYHSSTIIHSLMHETTSVFSPVDDLEGGLPSVDYSNRSQSRWQSRNLVDTSFVDHDVRNMSMAVAQRSQIFSDAAFLYSPWHIAVAVVTVTSKFLNRGELASIKLKRQLVAQVCSEHEHEFGRFEKTVDEIVQMLIDCPEMELRCTSGFVRDKFISKRAEELKQVLAKVSCKRFHYRMQHRKSFPTRKRSSFQVDFTPPRPQKHMKYARVTPTGELESGT